MAGDWIKMRYSLLSDRRVVQIARTLADDENFCKWMGDPVRVSISNAFDHTPPVIIRHLCVSTLLIIWGAVAEQGKRDGDDAVVDGFDCFTIDEIAGVPGFADAMLSTEWLEYDDEAETIARFCGYLKENLLATERGKESRRESNRLAAKRYREKKSSADSHHPVINSSSQRHPKVSPREEKRREDKKASAIADADCAAAAATGLRFKSEVEAMVGRTGFPAPDGRSLDEIRKAIGRIESGMYPDALGVPDPLAYLEARLRWYWDEQAVRRKHAERRLEVPSLRKTLADDRWRVDPDAPHWEPAPDEKPKVISEERARALDRLTRRTAS